MSDPQADQRRPDGTHPDDAHPTSISAEELRQVSTLLAELPITQEVRLEVLRALTSQPPSITPEEVWEALGPLRQQPPRIGHENVLRLMTLPEREASDASSRKDDPDE